MRLVSLLLLTGLAGCGGGAPDANQVASAEFVPPVTAAPDPVEGQRNVTPLTAYIGRYPRDAVNGVSFFDRTEVANALVETVPDADLRALMIGRDAVQVPIFRLGNRIAAHGCEAHNCDGRNWTVLVTGNGDMDEATVCHHDADTMGDASQWATRRGRERRSGSCPQA
jgi:hypothetical protein